MKYHYNEYKSFINNNIGVFLLNIGSPKSTSIKDIKSYLNEFLSNKRIINLPNIIWKPILGSIILNIRPKKSAKKYISIWKENQSPLVFYSHKQALKLQENFNKNNLFNVFVKDVMCIESTNVKNSIDEFKKNGINTIICIPMFPQYSSCSTGFALDIIYKYLLKSIYLPNLITINQFYKNELYIKALANKIKKNWEINGKGQRIIFSFHSIPLKINDLGDPYKLQCYNTIKLLSKELKLQENEYIISFQSRFGFAKWLSPSTIDYLKNLPKENIKNIDICCPGFVCDCLETLEEINIEGKEIFLQAGGKNFNYIECLNDDDELINCLYNIISPFINS